MNMHTQKRRIHMNIHTQKRGAETQRKTHIRDLLLGTHKRDVSTHKRDVSRHKRDLFV